MLLYSLEQVWQFFQHVFKYSNSKCSFRNTIFEKTVDNQYIKNTLQVSIEQQEGKVQYHYYALAHSYEICLSSSSSILQNFRKHGHHHGLESINLLLLLLQLLAHQLHHSFILRCFLLQLLLFQLQLLFFNFIQPFIPLL